MKKTTLFLLALIVIVNCFSQGLTKEDYLQKAKNQKTAALVLAGGGSALVLFSLVIFPDNYSIIGFNSESEDRQANAAGVVFLIGGAAMVSSIPFFILSGSNKKKAASLSFRMEKQPLLQRASLVNISYPSLALRVKL